MSVRDVHGQVLVLALVRMCDSVSNSFLVVVLPLYIAAGTIDGGTLGFDGAVFTGIVLAAFGLVNSVAQPFAGRSSDRTGVRRRFVLAGLALLAISTAALPFVAGAGSLLAVRVFQGAGVALTVPATLAIVNELATTDTRGGSMGVYNTFRLVGYGIGPVGAGAIVGAGPYTFDAVGTSVHVGRFDAAFALAALAALVGFLLVSVFVTEPERADDVRVRDELGIAVRARGENRHLFDPVFTLGVATLFMATGIGLFTTIQPAVNARLNQGPAMFGIEFGAFVAGQVIFQTPVGSASDRYGRRPFIVWGLVLLVPATLAQGLVVAPSQMIVARILQGIAAAMVFAPSLALAGDLAGEGRSGTTLAVLTMAFGLGTAVGPLASGTLIRYGFLAPFAFGAVLAAFGAVLVSTQVSKTADSRG